MSVLRELRSKYKEFTFQKELSVVAVLNAEKLFSDKCRVRIETHTNHSAVTIEWPDKFIRQMELPADFWDAGKYPATFEWSEIDNILRMSGNFKENGYIVSLQLPPIS